MRSGRHCPAVDGKESRDGCLTLTCSLRRDETREYRMRIEAVGDGRKVSSVGVTLSAGQ